MESFSTIGIYAYTKSAHETIGGIEAQVTHLSRSLASEGYKVIIHFLASEDVGIQIDDENDFSFGSKIENASENIKIFRPSHGPGLEGAIEENTLISLENKEDIILCFGTRDGYVFDLAIGAKNKLGIPLVSFVYFTVEERWYRSHFSARGRTIYGLASQAEKDAYFLSGENTVKKIVNESSLVIAPTHYVRGQLITIAGVEHTHKIKICYHGVDENLFRRTSEKDWSASDDLLIVARLSVPFSCDKGFLWATKFFSERKDDIPQSTIRFCGAGNGQSLIKKFAEKNNMLDSIDARGYVDQETLVKIYNTSSCLLIPSMMEAGCTAVIEAVMCGCLPIALDSAGLAEIMESVGLDRYLLPGKPKRLAPSIEMIVPIDESVVDLLSELEANQDLVRKDLERARQIALEKFSLTATTSRLIRIIKETEFT